MSEVKITGENFAQEVEKAENRVLLDFWAAWCGPCRMIAPIVEEIAEEYPQITVGKINVDEEADLAARFEVNSIPTLVVMEKGQPVARMTGYRSKAEIEKLLGSE